VDPPALGGRGALLQLYSTQVHRQTDLVIVQHPTCHPVEGGLEEGGAYHLECKRGGATASDEPISSNYFSTSES